MAVDVRPGRGEQQAEGDERGLDDDGRVAAASGEEVAPVASVPAQRHYRSAPDQQRDHGDESGGPNYAMARRACNRRKGEKALQIRAERRAQVKARALRHPLALARSVR